MMWKMLLNRMVLLLTVSSAILILFILSTCGGGGGSDRGSIPDNVTITGVVDDGSTNSPIPDASCSFIDNDGQTHDTDICEQDGSFQLNVPSGTEGYIYCGPQSMPDLNLTTFSSTVGYAGGETKPNENVTPTTTVAADIIRYENPSDPESRKAELLLQANQDPNLAIVTEIAGRLYRTMLAQQINARFGDDRSSGRGDGDDGGSDSDGGVGGAAGDGADFSPLPEARCAFVIGDDFESAEQIYPAALADYIKDGELDRPDLAGLAPTVSQGLPYSPEEIQQAFEAWFPEGLGEALTTITDEDGYYFLPIPANLAGYVRCTPKDLQNLVLGTYTPGRQAGTDLVGQDINPATTIFSAVIATELAEDLGTVKANFLGNIEGLEVLLDWPDYPEGSLDGFTAVTGPNTNNEVGLVAFSATALFNALYKNDLNADFLAALAHLAQHALVDPENPVDPTFLETQGIPATRARELAEIINTSVNNVGDELGTDLATAFSTARINVTVKEAPDSVNGIPGALVIVDTKDVFCDQGCGQETDDDGRLTLTLSGVSTETATTIPVRVSSVAGYDEVTATTEVVAFATVDLEVVLGTAYTLTVEGGGNGSGTVISSPAGILCDINRDSGRDDGDQRYAGNTLVTLTATPEAGSAFDGWSGACTGTDTACTVTMDANKRVTARFSSQCAGDDITIDNPAASFGADGGRGGFNVTAPEGCPWSVSVSSEASAWLTLTSTGNSTGNGRVTYDVSANETTSERSGTLTVGNKTHRVTQGPRTCTVELSEEVEQYPHGGGSGTIIVTVAEGCPWTAIAEAEWITITAGDSGSGGGLVSYSVQANTTSPARTGIIRIGGVPYTVRQDAAPCSFSIDPTSNTVTAAGETYAVSVDALYEECAWTTEEEIPWISLSPAGGTGDGAVSVSVDGNDGDARNATIQIAGLAHSVNQEAITDTTAPTPNPMTWATEPHATSTSAITMTASTASDPSIPINYQFDFVDSPTGGAGGTDSNWQSGTTYTDSGLGANHRYGYRVRARDGEGNTTGYSTTRYDYTDIEAPSGITFGTITTTSIQARSSNTPSGLTRGESGLIIYNVTGETDSGWRQNNDLWPSGPLSVNSRYGFNARARNGDGDPTDTSATAYRYTYANTPGSAQFSDVTSTSLQANWTANGNPSGTQYYCENTTAGTNSGWISTASWNSTGLTCGRSYTFRVRARNGDNVETGWRDLGSRQTAACADTTPPSPDPMTWATEPHETGTAAIAMTASTASDPSTPINYQFDFVDSPTGGTGGTDSNWQGGTSYTDSGLGANHRYGYRVRARDGEGNPTGYSTTSYDYTDIQTPSGITFGTITTTSIQARSSNTPSGLTRGESGLIIYNVTGETDSGWRQNNNLWTSGSLSVNSRYGFNARARNGDGDQTGTSATAYRYTRANTPGSAQYTNVTETSIRANWTANGNPGGTQYYCENTTAGTNSGWISATSWNSTGLTCGQSYSFRVRARNGDNVETGWRDLGSRQTAACADTTPPSPDPMTWATVPYETGTSAIAMRASTASDPSTPINYQFDFVDSPTGGAGGTDSNWQSGTTYTDSGLGANHRYGYRVRARDGEGNPTGYSTTSYDYTDIQTPSGITFGSITSTSIQARSSNTPSGLTRGNSGLIIYNVTRGTNSGWRQNNNLWTSGSLSVNSRYGFNARARNGDGDQTGTSATAYRYTDANPPLAASFSNQTQTSIRANWTANNNPSGTQYRCHNITTNEYSGWTTNRYWVDTGLTCGHSYSFRVRARNGDGEETDWVSLGVTSTSVCTWGYFYSITLDPPSPAYLIFNQTVVIDYYYYTNGTSNFWIQIRPFTNGSVSPGATSTFAYQVSSNHGYRSHSFTIQTQPNPPIIVDQIQFRLWADGALVETHVEDVYIDFDTLY